MRLEIIELKHKEEQDYFDHVLKHQSLPNYHEDRAWLIARIRQLESILKYWADESEWFRVPLEVQIERARKALKDEV